MPPLTPKQKTLLRGLAHHRRPLVTIGAAGLSESVVKELDDALTHHELVKVKLGAQDRDARRALAQEICAATASELVQQLGRMVTVYRRSEEPKITL